MINDKLDAQFEDSLFARLEQQRRTDYFLRNDPRFLFEYKKMLLQEIAKKSLQSKKEEKLKNLLIEAEKRRIQFMIDALEEKHSSKKSVEELLESYKKVSLMDTKQLNQLIKKAKKAESIELTDNPDYQSMKENFNKMNKKIKK